MTPKLKFVLPTVAAMTFISVSPAAAFWPFNSLTHNSATTQSTLLDKIIAKFNLNKDEVNQVVSDYRTENRQQMQSQYEARLNQAVADGKITEAQKKLILDKHNQLQSQREELQAWAKENNLDLSYLGMGMGRGGRGMGMVRGER